MSRGDHERFDAALAFPRLKSPLKGGTTNEEEDPERDAPGTDWSGTLAATGLGVRLYTLNSSLSTPLADP